MILGIDYGTKRIGLATGDKEIRLALPYETLLNDNSFFVNLKRVCQTEKIEEIIVGIPFPVRGKEGRQIERVEGFIDALKKEISLPVKKIDERFTTREVESHFVKLKKEMKRVDKDAAAAAIILQAYLDKT